MNFSQAEECFRFRGEKIALPRIRILAEDYEVLADIVCASPAATPGVALLWRELKRAVILHTDHAPSGLIHLNSTVRYTDLTAPLHRTVRLVDPGEGRGRRRGLSVASAEGAALIGLKVGDRFPWVSARDGMRILRVDRVAPDPLATPRVDAARAADRRRLVEELLSAR